MDYIFKSLYYDFPNTWIGIGDCCPPHPYISEAHATHGGGISLDLCYPTLQEYQWTQRDYTPPGELFVDIVRYPQLVDLRRLETLIRGIMQCWLPKGRKIIIGKAIADRLPVINGVTIDPLEVQNHHLHMHLDLPTLDPEFNLGDLWKIT